MDDELARRLAFVAPERRALVEKRLAILRAYVALERPTMEHSRAAAADMGLTTAGFYRLVAVWRRTRDPAVLDGTAGPAPGPQPSRFDDEPFIRTILDGLPAGQTVERDVDDVLLAAQRAGRQVRGRSTLRRLITELRAARDSARSTTGGVLIDHAALLMPVEADEDGAPTMPIATVVVDMGRRTILAIRLAIQPAGAATTLAALRHAAARGAFVADPSVPSDLTYERGAGEEWNEAEALLKAAGVMPRGGRSRTIRGGLSGAMVIPTLLGIRTRPGIVSLAPDRRRAKIRKGDRTLPLQVAQHLIDERLAYARADGPTPFSRDPSALLGIPG